MPETPYITPCRLEVFLDSKRASITLRSFTKNMILRWNDERSVTRSPLTRGDWIRKGVWREHGNPQRRKMVKHLRTRSSLYSPE
jgi:hypothetical protein